MFLLCIAVLSLFGMALGGLLVQSVSFESLEAPFTHIDVPAPYMKMLKAPQRVTVSLYYSGYGNTALRLTPRFCLGEFILLNDASYSLPQQKDRWCNELIVDFKEDLQRGENTLVLTVLPPENPYGYPSLGLSINPVLLGYSWLQSLAIMTLIGSTGLLLWRWLNRRGWDQATCLILMSAYGLLLISLYTVPDLARSLDLEKHSPYIQYMREHSLTPYAYNGPERWQPPSYYLLSAMVMRIIETTNIFGAWVGLRVLSLIAYGMLIYYGARCAQLLLRGRPFYLALCLIAFWPSGLFSPAWVFNDVLVYPLYAACFYYTLLWHKDGKPRHLGLALGCCGLAFAVKTTALVLAGIVGVTLAARLLTRHNHWRDMLAKPVGIGGAVLVLGIAINMGRLMYSKWVLHKPYAHLSGRGDYDAGWSSFSFPDIGFLLTHPLFTRWDDPSAWGIFIRTMLFTNSRWHAGILASGLMLLFLGMAASIVLFFVTAGRERWREHLPVWAGLWVPIAACITFTVRQRFGSGMDFRYIEPMLIAFVLLFVLSLQHYREKGWNILYRLGTGIAMLFPVLSLLFFIRQW